MLTLEDFMNVRDLKQQGWSVSAIAAQLNLDRKTVRRYLLDQVHPYKRENPAACKVDAYRSFLRERWEQGVHNARKLLDEIRERGYGGGYSQLKLAVAPWRDEERERAFVRFETGPGEQSQMDWGHFGNWNGSRLYGFGFTLCYSRMRYVEFTQRQDIHHLLSGMVHAFHYFGGVTECVLTDRMKTVLLDRTVASCTSTKSFWTLPRIAASCREFVVPTGRKPKARSSRPSAMSKRTSGPAFISNHSAI